MHSVVHLLASTPASTQNKQQQVQQPTEELNPVFAHMAGRRHPLSRLYSQMVTSHINNHPGHDKT
jgi:hypothetical protein